MKPVPPQNEDTLGCRSARRARAILSFRARSTGSSRGEADRYSAGGLQKFSTCRGHCPPLSLQAATISGSRCIKLRGLSITQAPCSSVTASESQHSSTSCVLSASGRNVKPNPTKTLLLTRCPPELTSNGMSATSSGNSPVVLAAGIFLDQVN